MRSFVMLLIGFGVGYLISSLWPGDTPPGQPEEPVGVGVIDSDQGDSHPPPVAEAGAQEAPSPGRALRQREDFSDVRRRAIRLAAEERSREALLVPQPASDGDRQEARPASPIDLERRFSTASIRRTIESAFAEMDLEGRIVAEDCSEQPCLLMGAFKVEEARDAHMLPTLLTSAPFAIYQDDPKSYSAVSVPVDPQDREGAATLYFGLYIHPAGEADADEEIRRRFDERFPGVARRVIRQEGH